MKNVIHYPVLANGWYAIVNSWGGGGNKRKIHFFYKSFTSLCGCSREVDRGLRELKSFDQSRKCKQCLIVLETFTDLNNYVSHK